MIQISNKVKYGAIFGGVMLMVYGIYKYVTIQKKLLEDFDYKFLNIYFTSFDLNNVSGNVIFEFINKSNIEVVVESLAVDFYIDGNYVGWLEEGDTITISPNSSTQIPLQFYVDPSSFLSSPSDIVYYYTNASRVMVNVTGYATISSGFVRATVPIDYEKSLRELMS